MKSTKNSSLENKARILKYWSAIEMFTPQKIPKKNPQDLNEPVFEIAKNDLPPWSSNHPLQKRKIKKGNLWRHTVYCGIYRLDKFRESMEATFGKDEETFDQRPDGESCLFAISLTPDGRPLFDSFVLSTCAWASGRLKNPGPSKKDWLEGFDSSTEELLNHLKENFKIAEEDEEGQSIISNGVYVGCSASLESLISEVDHFISKLALDHLGISKSIRIKSIQISKSKVYSTDDVDFLNSFFVKDLQKVADAISIKSCGAALASYLCENEELNINNRIDLRQADSTNIRFSRLSPANIPIGRWPSKDHKPLVYGQQFAVNSIFEELSDKPGLFAVNGPPGSGKTTLLRDLIAGIIVNRAIKISELSSPSAAFNGESRWKSGDYNRVISLWKEEFKGYEIVIASSNNGAVENVTLEIPGIDEIDGSWRGAVQYYDDIASRLIDKQAWALLAARLGKKANRSDFINRFWYSKKEEGEKQAEKNGYEDQSLIGFLDYLKNLVMPQIEWKTAVMRFKAALEEENGFRSARIKTCNLIYEKDRLHKELRELNNSLVELQRQEPPIKSTLDAAEEKLRDFQMRLQEAIQKRERHRKFRSSLLEIILTLGRAFREWRKQDKEYQSWIITVENSIEATKTEREDCKTKYGSLINTLNGIRREIDKAQNKLSTVNSEIAKEAENLGQYYPDLALWQDDTQRELSSPWLDPEWNEARVKVFLEALALHKAFIEANKETFRKNLHAAMDLLSGAVPDSAPIDGITSAWTTFFFVIPVVSSTFASFDRLFSHLSSESIGWLMIDEAGQAKPQDSAGAIWRAKRAVIVGDPLQLKPVVSIPFTAQEALRKFFRVGETWLPKWTSTQALADRTNRFGAYIPCDAGRIWVGSPLRVHRRCDDPMFSISNRIAYDGMMVFGTLPRKPLTLMESCWIDVQGRTADGHWIEEEGEFTLALLNQLIASGIKPTEIFLISPFRDVVKRLRDITRPFVGVNCGTIHTVQGKEADIVILVLGGNPNQPGAKNWAAEKPNLLNVAASRAKRRLYVIGNKDLWRICNYFSELARVLPKPANIIK